ncbi:hypothetical protein BJ165DRAFT_1113328 [Panaeolus papilionaceus]|nr:hypothetical protein BJ165DRAFT_1113328 [Panaeolus papilionaceus]
MASSPAPSSASSAPPSPSSTRRNSASHAFKCPALPNPRTHDVFQSIVKGRKSWKTLRGGEVVWPPELEAALIEGLENYQPDDSRETRLLGRFPMRNRFISDWIYEKTGKRRTAKQVGSRLQQLRDTCGGKRLLNLLSPNRRPCRTSSLSPEFQQQRDSSSSYGPPPLRYESESCSDSSVSAPATPTEAHATLQSLLYRGVEPRVEETPETIVCIDLLPEESPNGQSPLKPSEEQGAEEQQWVERGYKVVHAAQQPRYLRDIDPTVTLLSHSPTSAQSHFTVYTDDGIVFSETTDLELVEHSPSHPMDGSLLYRTSLVPGYWSTIGQTTDASQYVIIQRVIQEDHSTGVSSTVFAAMYRFNYTTLSQPEEQTVYSTAHLMATDQTNHKADFNSYEAMIPMDADGFSDMMGFAKTQPYFDMNSYMGPEEWGANESVYASPIDCNKPNACMISGATEQLLSPTASYTVSDVPPYVSSTGVNFRF